MQTIKVVVVGDGAVGKVRDVLYLHAPDFELCAPISPDLFVDLIHHEQISKRLCSDCKLVPPDRQTLCAK